MPVPNQYAPMPNMCTQTHGHNNKMKQEKLQETRYFKG